MSERSGGKPLLLILAGLTILGARPRPALAQAWLPPKGEASLSFGSQYEFARYHLLWEGQRDDRGRMEWYHAISDLSYGVTDRFALRVGIPYVFSKYTGAFPHIPPTGRPSLDDGAWHHTFQDFSFEARFMARTGSLVVTPFLATGLPSTGYETHSHVAPGRHVREYTGGVNLGRRLDPILPEAYAHTRLSFTMAERVNGIWHNRNNADVDLGYFVSPSVSVRAIASWQWTHGGFRIPLDSPAGSPNNYVHDKLAKDSHFILGGGVSFAATGSLDLGATYIKTISGENSLLLQGVSLGATWSFSPAQIVRSKKRTSPQLRPGVP
jgi:hypothetical protein